MRSFHGQHKRRGYFEGWYLKHQNGKDTAALIPAFHIDGEGRRSASLQVITDTQVYNVDFPEEDFSAGRGRFLVRLGNSVFSEYGCKLDIQTENLTLKGMLRYGLFTPPAYDMMGPFRAVPGMECRHSVFSLHHSVDGELTLNGQKFRFHHGTGYMEGDRGSSFPQRYLWTQCSWEENCIMLSVADIPLYGRQFTGCIGVMYLKGREYRIATYRGVKLLHVDDRSVRLRQGRLTLQAELLDSTAHPLRAPQSGGMTRTIHESPSCRVRYTCTYQRKKIFDFTSEQASFENNWEP